MRKPCLLTLGVAALGVATTLASAASATVYPPDPTAANNTLGTVAPYRGTYLARAPAAAANRFSVGRQPFSQLRVDLGRSGTAFVTLTTQTPAGGTRGEVIQGKYVPSDEVTRWTTGVIGSLTGPIYPEATVCATCVVSGQGAPAGAPTATLQWTNSREVLLTVDGETEDFQVPNLDTGSDGDYLLGRWSLHLVQTYNGGTGGVGIDRGVFLHDSIAAIEITASSGTVQVSKNAAPGLTAYHSGDALYGWTCIEELSIVYPKPNPLCDETFANLNFGNPKSVIMFWYDPTTRRLGADLVTNGVIGPANNHIDLYVESPDLIVGRGITEGTAALGLDQLPYGISHDGALNIQVILQRIPDDAFGADLPAS